MSKYFDISYRLRHFNRVLTLSTRPLSHNDMCLSSILSGSTPSVMIIVVFLMINPCINARKIFNFFHRNELSDDGYPIFFSYFTSSFLASMVWRYGIVNFNCRDWIPSMKIFFLYSISPFVEVFQLATSS